MGMPQDNGSLKQKVTKGAFWVLLEQSSAQIVGFSVGLVLARLLTPEQFGTVALVSIFFAVANVLVDSGFGTALIQKKDADELDFNSVFYLNFALSTIAYFVLFFAAPWIADFYKTPVLKSIVRVSAISFFFNAINAMQGAELAKKMLFHLSFRISLIMCITSAVFGVTLAFMGYGVWALVWSTLITSFVGTVARYFIVAWRPKLMFSWARLKPLFSYGWKMSASALLDQIFVNLNGMLIGKFYTKADLAYVNKGQSLPQLALNQVDGALGRVSFPALVELQDDIPKLREAMRRMIQASTFLVFPLMVGVAACSRSELRLLYGEQWVPAAPYMMLACFSYALYPFHTINLKGIMVLGRTDIFLKLEIIKKALKLIVILAAFRYGVFVFMAVSAFALGPLSVIINSWPNKNLLGYTIRMQIMDVLPTASICAVMAAVVFGVDMGFNALGFGFATTGAYWSLVVVLLLQFVMGMATFFVLAYAFRLKPMGEYVHMMVPIINRLSPSMCDRLVKRF